MSDIDLKAYHFGELNTEERRRVAAHLEANPAARAELAQLEATQAMLGFMQDEELPRRIAFVSDKVFEPTWWQRLMASGAQLGFASAALLAVAIVSHGWLARPVAVTAPMVARVDASAIREIVDVAVKQRLAEVAMPDRRDETTKMIAVALKQAEQKAELDRAADRLSFEENFNIIRRLISRDQVASYQRPVGN